MKVTILNSLDVMGGAARAAYRLHKGLRSMGIDTQMLVQTKYCDDHSVIGPKTRIGDGLGRIRQSLDSLPMRLYSKRHKTIFTPGVLPDRLRSKVADLSPDVIHLHWIAAGFIRIETLNKFRKPLIWTLHDSWAFTGGCHLPGDCTRYQERCGDCPTLGSSSEHDLSHWIWKRKLKSWKSLELTVVTPSRWLSECARSSSLFHDVRIEVIPNGLDLTRFRPLDKRTVRDLLSLPYDKKLILFGAMDSTNDGNKGFYLLLPALQKLAKENPEKFELLVVGSSEPIQAPNFGLKVNYFGKLHDEIAMVLLYAAADVFVAPSIQENLSNMVMESMACGAPCVAFNVGGMPDLIEHKRTGYLAKPFESDDLAHGIAWVLENNKRRQTLSHQARKKVENDYAIEKITKRYVDLYQEILTASKN